jgi:hypothetical protein
MLPLPATTAHGLAQSHYRPVVYTELVTALLDNPQVRKSRWDAALAQVATQVVSEQGAATDPLAMLQLAYPDPTRIEDGFSIVPAGVLVSVQVGAPIGLLGLSGEAGQNRTHHYQTIRLIAGEVASYQVSSVKLRLRRVGGTQTFSLIAVLVFPRDQFALPALDFSQYSAQQLVLHPSFTVSTATVSTSGADVTFTLTETITVSRDKQFAVYLIPFANGGLSDPHDIRWEGSLGANRYPREHAAVLHFLGTELTSETTPGFEGLELGVKVPVATYVWDGANTAYRECLIDLGAVPTEPGYVDLRYRTPAESRLRFRLWRSDASGAKLEDLGATDAHAQTADDRHDGAVSHVHDGDAVTVLSQYYLYRIEPLGTDDPAEVTQSLLYTPTVHGINVVFPKKIHKVASSPVLGAIPALIDIPSLTTQMDLKAYTAQAQTITPELADLAGYAVTPAVEVNLKNIPLESRFGVIPPDGLTSKYQLAPFAFGKVQDYGVEDGMTSWITKPWTADLSIKVPPPNPQDLNAALIAIDFQLGGGTHLIDALDHLLFNEARVPRRYKHRQSFVDAKAALGAAWITKRVIVESVDLRTLVNQLLEVIGYFLIQDEEGKLKLIRYPRSGNAVATWGDAELKPGTTQQPSFDDSIMNRIRVFWGYPFSEDADFAPDPRIAEDTASMAEWAPGSQTHVADREIKGYWLSAGSAALAEELAKRSLRGEGMIRITCETMLSQYAVQVGDFVMLQTPVYVRKGSRGSMKVAQKFMVIRKTVDIFNEGIRWELVEALDRNRPPTGSVAVSPESGTAPFSVTVTPSFTDPDGAGIAKVALDEDYDGVTFQGDQVHTGAGAPTAPFTVNYGSGTAGRKVIAVMATDVDDGTAIRNAIVRAKVVPEARIDIITQTNPGQPLNAILSGAGSTSRSGQIAKHEWDLTYVVADGFNAEVTGAKAVISMPYAETTVALRVTDADGLTAIATLVLTGKTLAPAAVANFLIQQQGDRLIFSCSPLADGDIDGLELRGKYEPTGSLTANWTTADLLTPNGTDSLFKVTLFSIPAPRPYGTWSFFAKWKDTSTNYSANATIILVTTSKPGDRFGVLTDWSEKDDSADWSDSAKTTDLIYEAANTTWWISSTGELLGGLATETLGALATETLGSLGTLEPEGVYASEVQDFGAILTGARVAILPQVVYLGNPEEVNVIIEARIATTTSGSPATPDWGAWGPISIADLTMRYLQVRIKLQQFDGSSNIGLKDIIINVDLPTVVQSLEDLNVSSAGSGSTWTFPVAFQVTPRIGFAIQAMGTTPLYLDITAKSKTAVTVKVRRNSDGVDVGSGGVQVVDLIATGA